MSNSVHMSIVVAVFCNEYPIPESSNVHIITLWPGPYDLASLVEYVNDGMGDRDVYPIIQRFFDELTGSPEKLAAFNKGRQNELSSEATIFVVRGYHDHVVSCFDEYVAMIAKGPQGCDDDTYDYWPDAFGMTYDWAMGIDRVMGNTRCMDHLYDACKDLNVDEWELPPR